MDQPTHVPLPEFTPTGLQLADLQAILEGVLKDYVTAFALTGRTLSTELSTPQGQLAQAQAYMINAFQVALASLVALVDPATSYGTFQDAIGRLNFLTRKGATHGYVNAIVYGTVGQQLPRGALVQSLADRSLWQLTNTVVFGANGQAAAVFQAQLAGSTPVAGINGLRIYQQYPGWEQVTNAAPSVPGRDTETPRAFEARRRESVQIGGRGSPEAVYAAVADLPDVLDVYVYNNGSDEAIEYGETKYPIPAHSIAISVAGGDELAIAKAIWSKLDCGCGFSTKNTVSVTLQETKNYRPPYPTYIIRFVRPTSTPIYFTVNVAASPNLPANYIQDVQTAISDAFTKGWEDCQDTLSVERARMGSQLVAAEFAAPVLALGNVTPVSIYVSRTAAPTTGESITLGIDEQPVCPPLNVKVEIVDVKA